MKYLSYDEEMEALQYNKKAAKVALQSTCDRAQCGTIIVKDCEIIGSGFNSPAQNEEKRCSQKKSSYHRKVTDKTCCVHAEQRAIMNALHKNPGKIVGSRLYFIRLDNSGSIAKSGKPYCTICSKMALDVGIKEFVLWHKEGICVYDTQDYNKRSYRYQE